MSKSVEAKMKKNLKLNEFNLTPVSSYTTESIPPTVNSGGRLLYKIPRTNFLDGERARIVMTVVADTNDFWSTNPSGVFALFESATLLMGGTQIQTVPLRASNYYKMKKTMGDLPSHPSKQLYVYGMQNQFADATPANTAFDLSYNQVVFEPETTVTWTTSASSSYDVVVYLKDLFDFFESSEIPLYALDSDLYVDITLKDSSLFAQVAIQDVSNNTLPTGYSISTAPLVCDFIRYPDAVMNAKREMPYVKHVTDVMATTKAPESTGSTNVQMNLANKQLKRVNVAVPMADEATGVDNSWLKRYTSADTKINIRVNGQNYWNQDVNINTGMGGILYANSKDSYNGKFTCAPGTFIDQASPEVSGSVIKGDSSGMLLSTDEDTPWGDSTYDAFGGANSYMSFNYQKDPAMGDHMANATRCENKPIEFTMEHPTSISGDAVAMYAEVQKLVEINPNGNVNILEGLPSV